MRLTFTRRGGKHDDLLIEREGLVAQTITCPKQGIIPHDMVHYAVELVLAHRGFPSLVAGRQPAEFRVTGDADAEAIERLVETFQAEMWGGRVPAEDLLATYEHSCAARGHAVVEISVADVTSIRLRLDGQAVKWTGLTINESLTLEYRATLDG